MALTTDQKLEKVWEWFNNNADTSTGKAFYEETIPRSSEVHSSEVFGQAIPSIPPMATAGVVKKWYPAAENGDGMIYMTCDRSVGGNKTWVALENHSANWSSGSADVSEVLKGFIGPKYGKQYLVKVFDKNDNEIPQLDTSDWTFDYSSGVLVFNSANRSESGATPAASIKIKVYQYVGKSAAEMIEASAGAGAGGRERVRASLTGAKDGVNMLYSLPADCDTTAHYELQVNGVGVEPVTDFNVGVDPLQLTLVVALTAAEKLDVVYYPVITP